MTAEPVAAVVERPGRFGRRRTEMVDSSMTPAELRCLEQLVRLERSPGQSHTVRLVIFDALDAKGITDETPMPAAPRQRRRRNDRDPRSGKTWTTLTRAELRRLDVLVAMEGEPSRSAAVRNLILAAIKAKGITDPGPAEEGTVDARGQQLAAVAA